ncbi:MAG: hypothetical protein M3Y04_10290 [Actinomycetota bacterium]|nr:hypothetical protein [Actinomycetota bacterium]
MATGVVVAMLVGVATLAGVAFLRTQFVPKPAPTCLVTSPAGRVRLSVSRAANAATIAAVGKREGMVDHAVTVALVAALQESKLDNLPFGDLDSVGLFQQRPSQGWGTPPQLMDPNYAATAFYTALRRIPGWEALPVGDAAQAVQRSAAPDAYGPWEREGRVLADALTGESSAAFACQFDPPASAGQPGSLAAAVSAELGSPALDSTLADARGWTVASWLVAHGYTYHITSVSFLGYLWTSSSGTWQPRPPTVAQVQVGRL